MDDHGRPRSSRRAGRCPYGDARGSRPGEPPLYASLTPEKLARAGGEMLSTYLLELEPSPVPGARHRFRRRRALVRPAIAAGLMILAVTGVWSSIWSGGPPPSRSPAPVTTVSSAVPTTPATGGHDAGMPHRHRTAIPLSPASSDTSGLRSVAEAVPPAEARSSGRAPEILPMRARRHHARTGTSGRTRPPALRPRPRPSQPGPCGQLPAHRRQAC